MSRSIRSKFTKYNALNMVVCAACSLVGPATDADTGEKGGGLQGVLVV